MNAARILDSAGVDLEALRVELAPVVPEKVNVWPAARFVRALWRSGIRGVTLFRLVLADPEVLDAGADSLARFVVHELVHVHQFARQGYLRFMVGYLSEYWRGRLKGLDHRAAYLAIGAEVEAREIAARYVQP